MAGTVFAKDKGSDYFTLLKLSCLSNNDLISEVKCQSIIATFNNLMDFSHSHNRLIPLLKHKAQKLNIFNELNFDVQNLLNTETKKGVVTELAKEIQLKAIIQKLSLFDIPIILLKGVVFNKTIYPSNAPRISNDIDILVKKKDWIKVNSLLNDLMAYSEKKCPDVFGDLYEVSFTPKNCVGAAVDLHCALINPYLFNIDENDLWTESQSLAGFNNDLVRTLCPEHLILHQAIHAYKDMDFAKYNMVDTFEVLQTQSIDNNKLYQYADKWNVVTPLYILLKCNEDIISDSFEQGFMRKIRPNMFCLSLAKLLLTSPSNQPIGDVKNFKYRVNQIMSQFIFTASLVQPFILALSYIKGLTYKSLKNAKLIK